MVLRRLGESVLEALKMMVAMTYVMLYVMVVIIVFMMPFLLSCWMDVVCHSMPLNLSVIIFGYAVIYAVYKEFFEER